MLKDKLLAIRVPQVVHDKLSTLAKNKGVTLTDFVRDSLTGLTWEVELERNIEYHRKVIAELKEIEKIMRATQRARSKAMTGKVKPAKKKEQLELMK